MKLGSQSVNRIHTFAQDLTDNGSSPTDVSNNRQNSVPEATVSVGALSEVNVQPQPQDDTDIPLPTKLSTGVVPPEFQVQEDIPSTENIPTLSPSLKKQPQVTPPVPRVQPIAAVLPRMPDMSELSSKIGSPSQTSHDSVFADENTFTEGSLESGTIIRETRRKRFQLLPAMFSATVAWLGVQKSDYIARQPKAHMIEKSDARAEIIQKAAEKSEQAPREDFEVVSERLKNVERRPVSATLTFKPKEEVPEPSWTYTVAPKERAENTYVAPVDIVTENPVIETVTADSNQEAVADVTEPGRDDLTVLESAVNSGESISEKEVSTEVAPLSEESPIVQQAPQSPVPVYTPVPASTSREQKFNTVATVSSAQEAFPLSLLIGVIVAMTLSGIAVGYVFFSHRATDAPQTATPVANVSVSSLLHTQSKTGIPLGADRVTTLRSLQTAMQQSQDIAQIYPTVHVKDADIPATLEQTLQSLGLLISDSFARSIKEIDFGSVDGTDPYIVIRSSTFDTAFAGMLAWEPYMSTDLDPLFGPAVLKTFDPTSQAAQNIQTARFKDAVASNKSIRILLDAKGNDHIVYTFTDQNTVLITTTRVALDKLVQRMQ